MVLFLKLEYSSGKMSKLNLASVIQGSNLSESDKSLWNQAMAVLDDEQAQALLEMIGGEEEHLSWLTENIKMKKEAMTADDRELMRKIVADEKEKLSKIS